MTFNNPAAAGGFGELQGLREEVAALRRENREDLKGIASRPNVLQLGKSDTGRIVREGAEYNSASTR